LQYQNQANNEVVVFRPMSILSF